ncbi:hypothetical protein F2P81_016248 [Scophthalmus maximus]|uniref:Uncharacterized protein n=1 Tax=Scophthalmus maximus TaxID=52904 RepID=A0A6A4SC00_SCOMX|nr:hypothetical protein F2P81_016248 [Scophthalmus maximus]
MIIPAERHYTVFTASGAPGGALEIRALWASLASSLTPNSKTLRIIIKLHQFDVAQVIRQHQEPTWQRLRATTSKANSAIPVPSFSSPTFGKKLSDTSRMCEAARAAMLH